MFQFDDSSTIRECGLIRTNYKTKLTIVLLILVSVLVMGTYSSAAKKPVKKQVLKNKLGNVNQKIRQVKKIIWAQELKKRNVITELTKTQRKLEVVQTSLSQTKFRFQDAKLDLAKTIRDLEHKKQELERRKGLLTRRVVDIYEGDDINYANVILGASDMWTFLTRAYYLQKILDSDATLIVQIRADKQAIEQLKVRQAKRVSEIGTLQVRLESERNEVQELRDDNFQQIQAIEHDKDLQEKVLDELLAESNRIENEIQRFQNTAKGRAIFSKAFKGNLGWPCRGRITSRFAYRKHPITGVYKLHDGVDIAAPTGTPICSAADGVVMRAGWRGAYGYGITVAHGGNISTFYGHCSRIVAKVGDRVSKGQVIAKVGSTGSSTGPHCHFMKFVNGKKVNPLQ